MDYRVRGHSHTSLRNLTAVIAGLIALVIPGQLTAEEQESNKVKASSAETDPIDLVIVTKVPGNMRRKELLENIEDALAVSTQNDAKEVYVDPLPAADYELMKLLIESPERFIPNMNFTPPIELYGEGSKEWKIHSPNPHLRLHGITVKYTMSGQEKEEFFPARDANENSEEGIRFTVDPDNTNDYRFKSDLNWILKEYALHTETPVTGSATKLQPWPEPTRRYLVRLIDFTGGDEGRSAFFKAMGEKVVNRLVNVSGVRPELFSIANFRTEIPGVESIWNGNLYTVQFTRLGGAQQASKIWMLFPLRKEQIDEMRRFFEKQEHTPKSLREAFESGKVLFPVVTADGESPTALNPQSAPAWFEIPAVGGNESGKPSHYSRAFEVSNIAEWVNRFATGPAYAVTVYVGELRNDAGAVIGGRAMRVTKDASLWQSQEVSNWLLGLKSWYSKSSSEP